MSKNKDSNDINIKNIYYFFSTLNAMGLGEKIVEKIYNAGYKSILDFLKLKVDDINAIEGFKQKSAENIIASIKKSTTNIPLYLLMQASNKLGRGMGAERSKDVLLKYPNIVSEHNKYSQEQLESMLKVIDGWDIKTSKIFAENFKNFIYFYDEIKNYITIDTHIESKKEGILNGMKIVMSGFRDKILEDLIINNGGELSSGVSKNTTILIIKDESIMGTSKVIKAKDCGVKIHTIDSFKSAYKLSMD